MTRTGRTVLLNSGRRKPGSTWPNCARAAGQKTRHAKATTKRRQDLFMFRLTLEKICEGGRSQQRESTSECQIMLPPLAPLPDLVAATPDPPHRHTIFSHHKAGVHAR